MWVRKSWWVVSMELQPTALGNSYLQTILSDHITRGTQSGRREVMVLQENLAPLEGQAV